jgi:cell shape-determining protein MreD
MIAAIIYMLIAIAVFVVTLRSGNELWRAALTGLLWPLALLLLIYLAFACDWSR